MSISRGERLVVLDQALGIVRDLGFRICGTRTFLESCRTLEPDRALVMRHDVDADTEAAAKLARWEERRGITSTFLVMLQSPLYNLFSRSSCRAIDTILSCGHEIGLHFDFQSHGSYGDDLTDIIDSQAQMIADFFAVPVTTFSAHQPSARALDPTSYTGDLLSCYTNPHMRKLQYFSDSNRERNINELVEMATLVDRRPISDVPGIQLLIHPMWWIYDDNDVAAVWDRVLLQNIHGAQLQLASTERAFGAPRRVVLSREQTSKRP